jgi:taurine dioxygenase
MANLQVRELTPAFGAIVEGIDVEAPLDPESRALLQRTFDQRGALYLHDPALSFEYQQYLCGVFLGAEPGTEQSVAKSTPMFISNREPEANAPYGRLQFHYDMGWHPDPFQILSLYAADVEPGAATTSLTSCTYAYDILPDDLRRRIEGLHAVHVTGQQYSRGEAEEAADLLHPQRSEERSTTQPLVRLHPRTGRPLLYVSEMGTSHIVELPAAESDALLAELFAVLYDPALVYEHTWRNGDLVIFDNLLMQHARGDVLADGPTRTLRKVIAPVAYTDIETPRFENAR